MKDKADTRSVNGFLAEFYRKESSIKEFGKRRVPYHYDQGSMWKELITFLRSLESAGVNRPDRFTYLRVRLKNILKFFNILYHLETSLYANVVCK